MEIKTVPLLLIILGTSLLASCGRDSKLSDQLNRIEKREEESVRSDKFIFTRLKSLDENLQAIAREVGAHTTHQAEQEKLDAAEVGKLSQRLEALEGTLKALAQENSAHRQSLEQKVDELVRTAAEGQRAQEWNFKALASQIPSKAGASTARWAYVDKFRVQRETENLFQNAPLPAGQDPATNPELAAKLAEYQALQQRSMSFNFPPMALQATEKPSPEEMTGIKKKLDELRAPLAVYLQRQQQGTKVRDAAIQNAFREFSQGRFDLLIDRTFGDHEIYYKADIPVPDVTDQIITYIRDSQKKP